MSALHELLADLNGPQREAVEWGDGPLLVVAGAGSGKTRVITRRIAHLIARGVQPWQILAITFTNKAAGEMRERVHQLVGDARVTLATFHGFCARVLRVDGEAVGLPRDYSIYDGNDQAALVKDLCSELGVDTQTFRPRALLASISRLKNDALDPEEAAAASHSTWETVVARVYERYAQTLAAAHAVDFDDLLIHVTRLFREHPDVLARYQQRYRHVLIDEYQDTNLVQYRLARDVAAGWGNLCATGDPDQSIYRWRGARVQNILQFEQDFPGAHVVRLEQNYRSTNHILKAASAVIACNPGRMLGDLWSELGMGERVTVLSADDEEAEADAVVRRMHELRQAGTRLSEMAVFYRTNALSRALERALRLHNLAYEIVGAVEFYERKEVKDLLAYLRVLSNPADALAFLRIVNVPARGIGKTSIEKLRAWALPLGLLPREAARRAAEVPGLTAKPRAALLAFSALLDELQAFLDRPPEEVLRRVIEAVAYESHLAEFGPGEAEERLENVAELEAAVASYSRNATDPTVGGFLEETALVADVDRYDPLAERVSLMTLHSAKGLEFPAVFVVGLEEGLLPHQRSLENEPELQEERRLCYVGITRAQRHLMLSHALRRLRQGQWMPALPSRFLDELPEEHVVHVDRTSFGAPFGGGGFGGQRRGGRSAPSWEGGGEAAHEEVYVPDADDYLDVQLPRRGQAVRHVHFGRGVVLDVRGSGASARITVRFEHFGDKQLVAQYARLEPA